METKIKSVKQMMKEFISSNPEVNSSQPEIFAARSFLYYKAIEDFGIAKTPYLKAKLEREKKKANDLLKLFMETSIKQDTVKQKKKKIA